MVWEVKLVTQEVYWHLLMEKVMLAIPQTWPQTDWLDPRVVVQIQQDQLNAHNLPNNNQGILPPLKGEEFPCPASYSPLRLPPPLAVYMC